MKTKHFPPFKAFRHFKAMIFIYTSYKYIYIYISVTNSQKKPATGVFLKNIYGTGPHTSPASGVQLRVFRLLVFHFTGGLSTPESILKIDGWKTIVSFWVSAHFQGQAVSFREGTFHGKILRCLVRDPYFMVFKIIPI